MRYPIITDEHGAYLCPLPTVEWERFESPGSPDRVVPHHSVCKADLYLGWSFSIPVPAGEALISASDAHPFAVSHGWELTCTEGHVLARSTAEESAEPFSIHAYFESVRPDLYP